MTLFNNITIRAKLIIWLTLMVLALNIVGWRGVVGMSKLHSALERSLSDDFIPARIVANANSGLIALNRAVLNHMFATDSIEMQTFNVVIVEKRSYVQEQLSKLKQLRLHESGQLKLLSAVEQFNRIEPIIKAVLKNSRRDQQQDSADIIRQQLRPEIDRLDELMSDFLLLQEMQLDNALGIRNEAYNDEVDRILMIMAAVLFIIFLGGWNLISSVTRPLALLTNAAADLFLSPTPPLVPIKATNNDEIGHLISAFNHMISRLTLGVATLQLSEEKVKKLNRDQLKQLQNIDTVNKELESFTYSASHDLRQPLRSIIGFSQLLQEKYKDQLDATAQHYLERIVSSSRSMSELTDDLLKLSRLSQVALKPTIINFTLICHDVATNLRTLNPSFTANLTVEKNLMIKGDDQLIRILITNLLDNAFKFTSKVDAPRIEINIEDVNDEFITIFIRDNGAGFDMEYAGKLFLPFQRLHLTSDFDGSGIGLATVERVVRRHGGKIWGESKLGKGATFYFTLPIIGESDMIKISS